MISLNFEPRPMIDDRSIDMVYEHLLHSPPGDYFLQQDARQRLHTWPASDFMFDPHASPYVESCLTPLHAPLSGSPHSSVPTVEEKRSKKSTPPSRSPPSQQSPKSQQPPRRKLTTHKLSTKSYVDLITEAIVSTPERRMTLADIYKWMISNVPCFKQQANVSASSGWKNAVRHTLSLHKRFKRVQRGRLQKPAWWTIQEQEGGGGNPIATVAGRSPTAEYVYQRRHSESCFSNIKQENFSPATSYSNLNSQVGTVSNCFSAPESIDWTSSAAAEPGALAVEVSPTWGMGLGYGKAGRIGAQAASQTVFDREENEDEIDSAFDKYTANGGGYLTRTTSDASSYSPVYRAKTLTQAYSSINNGGCTSTFSKQYEILHGYNNEVEQFGPVSRAPAASDFQSVLVQMDKGTVAQISVPMPLSVDMRQQANQQAQTLGYINNWDIPKHYMQPETTTLPQDLLSVQVDSQVQCNVAEVLAYEMKASSSAVEQHETNELYDLLKAGCTLD